MEIPPRSLPIMPCFVLAGPASFLISMLMPCFEHTEFGALLCCPSLPEMASHRSQISDTDKPPTPSPPPSVPFALLNRLTVVYCSECLHPMCFPNLSSTQSPSQEQCYYCQQGRRGPIGVHCVWDIHYGWIRNYFHTFGWLWSQEMGVNSHAACLFSSCMACRCAASL